MILLDIEASGLSDQSYPVEVAWLDLRSGNHDAFLIHPAFGWTYWDEYAEQAIHKISREQLRTEGVEIREAAIRLNARLSGKTVYSDAGSQDQFWLTALFEESQIEQDFQVLDLYHMLSARGLLHRVLYQSRQPVPHRALADCQELAKMLEPLTRHLPF